MNPTESVPALPPTPPRVEIHFSPASPFAMSPEWDALPTSEEAFAAPHTPPSHFKMHWAQLRPSLPPSLVIELATPDAKPTGSNTGAAPSDPQLAARSPPGPSGPNPPPLRPPPPSLPTLPPTAAERWLNFASAIGIQLAQQDFDLDTAVGELAPSQVWAVGTTVCDCLRLTGAWPGAEISLVGDLFAHHGHLSLFELMFALAEAGAVAGVCAPFCE